MAMNDDTRKDRGSRLFVRSPVHSDPRSSGRVRLSHLRKLRECEQVAAVCYRVRNGSIEFLLVRTRNGGRWTFPKGSAEPGLTHAQAAALEAFEEAGVHGRIEEASFARYVRRKGVAEQKCDRRSTEKDFAVKAHLCLVLRLGKPKEANRNRTWFSVQDAKLRLRKGRENDGAEFARLVDKAVLRIQQQQCARGIVSDRGQKERQEEALEKVQFEAFEADGGYESSLVPHTRRRLADSQRSYAHSIDAQGREILQCEVLEFTPTKETSRNVGWFSGKKAPKALGAGTKNN